MSRVPLRFRDWWDDYDSFFNEPSLRTSRILDQHFGTGLRYGSDQFNKKKKI